MNTARFEARAVAGGRVEISMKVLAGPHTGTRFAWIITPEEADQSGLLLIQAGAYAKLLQQAQSK